MYVPVKGGEAAIDNAHRWLGESRRGDRDVPELSLAQIREQLGRAVDRVMCEGSLHDPELAALAIQQAQGDLIEAVFLLRAYRTTLPRLAASAPVDTAAMRVRRRVSAIYKDVPGGQVLGPTYDYTHRLLDFRRAAGEPPPAAAEADADPEAPLPGVSDLLDREGLVEREASADDEPVGDLTQEPLAFPVPRDRRLQALARGDEGFLLAMGYSTQRGYGNNHPFAGEIRMGTVGVVIEPAELGFPLDIGEITVTECQMVNQFSGSAEVPPQFTRGYGLTFGHAERKAMAMALVDRALRAGELGEPVSAPAQEQEFVLQHADNVQATGFVEHLKLPHYVDFQAELDTLRGLRAAHAGTEDGEAS